MLILQDEFIEYYMVSIVAVICGLGWLEWKFVLASVDCHFITRIYNQKLYYWVHFLSIKGFHLNTVPFLTGVSYRKSIFISSFRL